MWDNPRLLNAAAGFLVGLAALAFAAAATYWLLHSTLFPLRTVELRTMLKKVPRAQVQATLARVGRGNFFAAPIDELRAALEQLPWVRRASVRRVWPDALEVSIEEQVALARWAAGGCPRRWKRGSTKCWSSRRTRFDNVLFPAYPRGPRPEDSCANASLPTISSGASLIPLKRLELLYARLADCGIITARYSRPAWRGSSAG